MHYKIRLRDRVFLNLSPFPFYLLLAIFQTMTALRTMSVV